MEIKLNIYENNSSNEPLQTYTCYGLSLETVIKFEEYRNLSKGTDLKEQLELILEFIKSVFPDFKDEYLYKLRPNDLHDFMTDIGRDITKAYGKAEKN